MIEEEENISAEEPQPQPAEEAQPSPGEVPAEESNENMSGETADYEKYSKVAKMFIYNSSESFNSMLQMIQAGKGDITKTIADAALTIVDKMEQDLGEISIDSLQVAGITAIVHIFDLAEKAGLVEDVTKEMVVESVGIAFSNWIQKNPGRVDQNELQAMIQSPEAQEAVRSLGAQTEQPDQMAQGMIEGGA